MSRYRLATSLLVVFGAFLFVQTADARMKRIRQIPNNEWGCGACHVDPTGEGPRNDFGQQVEEHLSEPLEEADVDWQAIYGLDADGDGFTNGEELGDPNGEWSRGDKAPEADPTHPADPEETPDTAGMADAGNAGSDTGMSDDPEGACSVAGGSPVRGAWLVLVVGLVAVWRRE